MPAVGLSQNVNEIARSGGEFTSHIFDLWTEFHGGQDVVNGNVSLTMKDVDLGLRETLDHP